MSCRDPWLELKERIARILGATSEQIEEPKKHGDLAVPCFKLVKGEDPASISKKFEKELSGKIKYIREVKALGPYLNFYVDWSVFGKDVLKAVDKNYGRGNKKGKIMVEFAHPNTHKGFHIGHVRNICIGESLSRILEWEGYEVVRANYQGDVGPHISKVLWGLKNLNLVPPKGVVERGKWLGKVYADACKKIKEEGKEGEIKKITSEMYEGKLDKKTMQLWKETREWSLKYFDRIYKDFGVKFDRLYFESELAEKGKEYSLKLLKMGIAKKSEGAVVVDLTRKGLGVVVLLTKEGYALYTAKELGLAELEYGEFNPDRIIHVVAVPQTLFFKQLFELQKYIKPEWSERNYHLSYELVDLKGEKMASRLGNVVLYDDLIERIQEKVMKHTNSKKIAKKIAMAALKYGMLKHDNNRKILFDWRAALEITGNTGTYLQYTYARASSILRKGGEGRIGVLNEEKEIELLKKIAMFPEVIRKAASELKPNHIAGYLHEISEQFNSYYQTVRIIGSKKEKERLALVKKFRCVLKIGFMLLGIDPVEKM